MHIIAIPVGTDIVLSIPGVPPVHVLPAPLIIGCYGQDTISIVDLADAYSWVGPQPATEEEAAMAIPMVAEYLAALVEGREVAP